MVLNLWSIKDGGPTLFQIAKRASQLNAFLKPPYTQFLSIAEQQKIQAARAIHTKASQYCQKHHAVFQQGNNYQKVMKGNGYLGTKKKGNNQLAAKVGDAVVDALNFVLPDALLVGAKVVAS